MSKKGSILYYGVSPCMRTGFGRVSEEIIANLQDRWHFEVFGIGHEKYQNIPDGLENVEMNKAMDRGDGHGRVSLLELLYQKGEQYDILFMLQDYFVLNAEMSSSRLKKKSFAEHVIDRCQKNDIKIVLYVPVEERPFPDWFEPLLEFDRVVLYCDWARNEVRKSLDKVPDNIRVIEHGTNPSVFYPDNDGVEKFRESLPNPDDFLIGYIGDNQRRKNIGRDVIKAFSYYWKDNPDSTLFVKSPLASREGWHLDRLFWDERMRTGLPREKVLFPEQKSKSEAGTENKISNTGLNTMYNAFDLLILPSMEGWGLPVTEAYTAETPTLVGDHGALKYIGENGRSLKIDVPGPENPNFTARWVNDNNVQRTLIDIKDFKRKIEKFRCMSSDEINTMITKAKDWACERPWKKQTEEWDRLFQEVL